MHQANLFAAPALITGLRVEYDMLPLAPVESRRLVITPQWSKEPAKGRGLWSTLVGPHNYGVVPELVSIALETVEHPDVSTFMRRNLTRHYDQYDGGRDGRRK